MEREYRVCVCVRIPSGKWSIMCVRIPDGKECIMYVCVCVCEDI